MDSQSAPPAALFRWAKTSIDCLNVVTYIDLLFLCMVIYYLHDFMIHMPVINYLHNFIINMQVINYLHNFMINMPVINYLHNFMIHMHRLHSSKLIDIFLFHWTRGCIWNIICIIRYLLQAGYFNTTSYALMHAGLCICLRFYRVLPKYAYFSGIKLPRISVVRC